MENSISNESLGKIVHSLVAASIFIDIFGIVALARLVVQHFIRV